jgi:hypothetical protein
MSPRDLQFEPLITSPIHRIRLYMDKHSERKIDECYAQVAGNSRDGMI